MGGSIAPSLFYKTQRSDQWFLIMSLSFSNVKQSGDLNFDVGTYLNWTNGKHLITCQIILLH